LDEYLSDKEQIERLRAFWRDNGWYIIGGVALGAALLLGWNRYNAYQERRAEAAAALYQSLRDAAGRDGGQSEMHELLAQLRGDYASSPYADQAAMLVARSELISDPDAAVEELRRVMETSKDPDLALVARLRLARLLAYRQQYQPALELLGIEEPDAFTARYNEVEGDIDVALKDYIGARAAYQRALTAPPGEFLVDRSYVQMKLDDLPPITLPKAAPAGEGGS
jgi:predicted negative regulator of RcsB-dependent stress response